MTSSERSRSAWNELGLLGLRAPIATVIVAALLALVARAAAVRRAERLRHARGARRRPVDPASDRRRADAAASPTRRLLIRFSRESDMPLNKYLATSVAAAALALAGAVPAQAQSAGPFGAFAGNFHGGGSVVGADGRRERISCRARAGVGEGGRAMSQTIVCASDTYRLSINSNVRADGGAVSGSWSESTRGVSGTISGRVSDGRFSGRVDGGVFAASIALRASGRGLSMTLASSGGDFRPRRSDHDALTLQSKRLRPAPARKRVTDRPLSARSDGRSRIFSPVLPRGRARRRRRGGPPASPDGR